MIVKCQRCGTRYNLPDDKVGADGATVRCSRCQNVFRVESELPGPALGGDVSGPLVEDDFETRAEKEPEAARENKQFSVGDFADLGFDVPEPPQSFFSKHKRWLILGGGLFGLLLLTLTALFFLDILPFGKSAPKSVTDAPAKTEKKPENDRERLKDIALQGVRYYFVTNEKLGNLFVIDGKAVNNFKTVKGHIRLQASIFDASGVSILNKQRLAGNSLTYFQLQVLSEKEIEDALNSEVGIATFNTTVKPGEDVSFMFVFFSPPDNMKEFKVDVIDVKDPVN